MATAAELTGEEIAAVAESLSDPANLNVDTMTAIMHRIGPGLMALGQKVLVALIIFLIGRKIISMIEKMLSRSMEHAGMDVGVTRFLRALTQFVMNVFLLFMIAGQLGMDSASIVAVLGAAGLALSLALQHVHKQSRKKGQKDPLSQDSVTYYRLRNPAVSMNFCAKSSLFFSTPVYSQYLVYFLSHLHNSQILL